jgi:hypothetical protein
LLTSNFAAREPDHTSLDFALQVLRNQLPGPDELLDAASERLARLANTVTTEVRRHIDTWRQRINAYLLDVPFVKVEIPSDLNVAAPVASILQSHFPEKTVIIYTKRGGAARVELRSPEGGKDVGAALNEVAQSVKVHSYTGQKNAAYAIVDLEHLEDLLEGLSAKLDPNWIDDDDDE